MFFVVVWLPSSTDEGPLDSSRCREQLELEYRSSRSKIPLLPGMLEEFANMWMISTLT